MTTSKASTAAVPLTAMHYTVRAGVNDATALPAPEDVFETLEDAEDVADGLLRRWRFEDATGRPGALAVVAHLSDGSRRLAVTVD